MAHEPTANEYAASRARLRTLAIPLSWGFPFRPVTLRPRLSVGFALCSLLQQTDTVETTESCPAYRRCEMELKPISSPNFLLVERKQKRPRRSTRHGLRNFYSESLMSDGASLRQDPAPPLQAEPNCRAPE